MNIFRIVKQQKNKLISDLKNRVEIAKAEREADIYSQRMAKSQGRLEARKITSKGIIEAERLKASKKVKRKAETKKSFMRGAPIGGVFGSGSSGGFAVSETKKESVASKNIKNIWNE